MSLWVRATGSGPPLVCVHGLGVSSRYFAPLMRELAGDFRMLAPDLPGYGRTAKPRRPLGIDGLAEALGDWLEVQRLGPVPLLANSMGCQIVTELVAREPQRAGRLILVGPTVDPRLRGNLVRFALRDSLREPPAVLWIVLTDDLRFGLARLLTTIGFLLADRIEERLPRIDAPALVIHGGRDGFVSLPWSERVAALLPAGRLAVVADGAHAVHYSRPAEVAALVRAFLAEER
ncbi:MAG: alpha/beta fold hydrolase [Gaiellaceae bacterium]